MAGKCFGPGKRGSRLRPAGRGDTNKRPLDEVIRELKENARKTGGSDYREQSLSIHGLVCARCGRSFEQRDRRLLTVHHKDGNHHNNPADGSNWENLCVHCHDDIHSRGMLGDYLDGTGVGAEGEVVYRDSADSSGFGTLADKLRKTRSKG
ncbi:MAG: YajD family HNH nuclease [Syntrophales bacterium]|nr:YajD family HNH nuclease [Syntrophales bacterium]MCK9527150.1 YajD family HNH nuclease [Syntrophales bacterium]MDX9921725.1 YajD family HNH nuclease [Syntrophales bacterium]